MLIITNNKISEFIRFAIVGVIATGIHYGLYYVLQKRIEVNFAYTLAYLVSFVINFYMTSLFTFRTKPSLGKLFGLSGAHIVNYLMHIALLNLFLNIGLSKTWAPLPVFAIVIPVNFILVRFVFKTIKI